MLAPCRPGRICYVGVANAGRDQYLKFFGVLAPLPLLIGKSMIGRFSNKEWALKAMLRIVRHGSDLIYTKNFARPRFQLIYTKKSGAAETQLYLMPWTRRVPKRDRREVERGQRVWESSALWRFENGDRKRNGGSGSASLKLDWDEQSTIEVL